MVIVTYDSNKHQSLLINLLDLRTLPYSVLDNLPVLGLIALEDNKPIALGFLRRVEGNYGMLDSYITNPLESKELRHEALDGITSKLIILAKDLKIEQLFNFTADKGILSRAERHGFKTYTSYRYQYLSTK